MYAIVKTGGKQYRVEQGQSLLVERLRAASEGETVALDPLLVVDGDSVVDGKELSRASVSARVVAHERGPKLRVVKFKPKRGYKRRTGHRQELTRLEVTEVKLGATRRSGGGSQPKPVAATPAAEKPPAEKPAARKPAAKKPAGEAKAAPEKPKPRTRKPAAKKEAENGA